MKNLKRKIKRKVLYGLQQWRKIMKNLKRKILYRLQHWFGAPDPESILLEGTYESLKQLQSLLIEVSDQYGDEIQIYAEDDLTANVHTISMDDLIEFLISEFLRGDLQENTAYWRRKNEQPNNNS